MGRLLCVLSVALALAGGARGATGESIPFVYTDGMIRVEGRASAVEGLRWFLLDAEFGLFEGRVVEIDFLTQRTRLEGAVRSEVDSLPSAPAILSGSYRLPGNALPSRFGAAVVDGGSK